MIRIKRPLRALSITLGIIGMLLGLSPCFAVSPAPFANQPSSGELVLKAWEAHGRNDIDTTFKYAGECIELYSKDALRQQKGLKEMPKNKQEIEAVKQLNDVATAYFIMAESYMRQHDFEKAKEQFNIIIKDFYFAQAWDQRGWFWTVSDAAKQSVSKMETGSIELEKKTTVSQEKTKISLFSPGKEDIIDYEKYGEFQNIGTAEYKYIIKDQVGLSDAAGEGIYPNTSAIRKDPEFKKANKDKRLEGTHWDFLQSPDLEAAFLKWATAPEPPGVKLFHTGIIFEKSGMVKEAIKCYYAIVVHFPGTYGWTYWHTPWYVAQAAVAKINFLLRRNPELGYKLVGTDIQIINGYDNDVSNDTVVANPGKFVKYSAADEPKKEAVNRDMLSVIKCEGSGKVHLEQYENGDWQLIVEGKPYIIKGTTYAPTKVGQSPDDGTIGNWMQEDFNSNGKPDGPYDAFVDANLNNKQDEDEPAVGDFELMRRMGINTIRLYQHPQKVNKEALRRLYEDYGIRVILGDFLGKYAIGSGAPWYPGTDYNNDEHKKNMMQSVINMVLEFKDEPYILFWLLGNENVYGFACNADKQPDAFFSFANEVAKAIKKIDPEHPVAVCGGDTLYLDKFGKNSPDIDIFGTNSYRGEYGFGFLWRQVKQESGKPVFISEYGCPAHSGGKSALEGEEFQADYHRGAWEDIELNTAFSEGEGNSIGGVAFEWVDEWWKAYEPWIHDTKGLFTGPFPDGYMHEEWLGICSQGDGSNSPILRQLRKAYYIYKEMWGKQ